MYSQSIWTRWVKWNNQQAPIWSFVLLSLISISFFLSEWLLGIVTFADLTLGLVLILMLSIGAYRILITQIKWIGLPLAIIISNNIYQVLMNEAFSIKLGIASFIRIAFYLIAITGIFNYIKSRNYKKKFLLLLNWTALILGLIGIYITVALYTDGQLPYRFFWEFTRYDIYSYLFESNPNIIRTRSLFSEPAHFGYFLNLILSLNLFSKIKIKNCWIFNMILALIIFSTFSYSMIGIMGLIFIMKLIGLGLNQEFKWSHFYWIFIFGILILTIILWNFIEVTLIERTLSLFSGEDTSAQMRLIESWEYVNQNNFIFGNGIGHTPVITNNYAYFQSDLGLLGTLAGLVLTLVILKNNIPLGVVFILFNLSKGGYLGPIYWLVLICIVLFMKENSKEHRFIKTNKRRNFEL